MEKSPGFVDVFGDLGAQSVDRWELDFIAQALKEKDLDLGVGAQFNGMEVEQVSLDRKRICAEGGTVADVCDRFKALFTYATARDVNPVLRHQLFVAIEIDGRHRVLAAVASAATGG